MGITLVMLTLVWVFLYTRGSVKEQGDIDTIPSSVFKDLSVPGQSQVGGPDDSDEINALKREMARLRADLSALRDQFKKHAESQPAVAMGSIPEPAEEVIPPDPLEQEEQEAAMMAQDRTIRIARMQLLEANLRAETIDNGWSIDARNVIQQALTNTELKDTSVQGIECRATLCRLEVAHQDVSQRVEFEHHFGFKVYHLLPSLIMHTEENDDGSSRTLVYLFRAGQAVPEFPTEY
jgi:hypothetical protein